MERMMDGLLVQHQYKYERCTKRLGENHLISISNA